MDNPREETERPAPPPRAPQRRGRWAVVLLALAGVGAGGLWGVERWVRRRPPAGERPPADSPFLNTRPGVRYVGDERCAECHIKEALSYREHPMGRSVSPATRLLPGQRGAPRTFAAGGLEYVVDREGASVVHREVCRGPGGKVAAEQAEVVAWAVGSGRQGQTFLVDRGGSLYESPVSWYVRRKAWGLSPGYENHNDHFNRVITEGCLFCHTNGAPVRPGSVNHFGRVRLDPIGCERCHGPGELHVAARLSEDPPAGPDYTIVNPRHLEAPLAEGVCQQCHLQGEARVERRGKSLYDYRPGLPPEDFLAVFVRPPGEADARKAVSHVEQMHQSKCFTASGGKLGCTSCHDPHELPAEGTRVAFYRGRCLRCHSEHDCTLPVKERRAQSAQDSCVECHMPRGDSSNIAHTAITDHRVPRRPGQAGGAGPSAGGVPLVDFHRGAQRGRDLGVALAEIAYRPMAEELRRRIAFQARGLLERAVESGPEDVRAWGALGYARRQSGSPREAREALEEALSRSPRAEPALEDAAQAAMELRDLAGSESYWRRLVEANPSRWHAHAFLAQVLAMRGRYAEAASACRKALALNPLEGRARMLRIACLLRAGEPAKARAELDALLALRPGERDKLRKWFDEEKGAAGAAR